MDPGAHAWCDSLEQFTGAYSGTCRIHRSELLQLTGVWTEAAEEAQLACRQLGHGYGLIITGGAFYQLAEIHRLHGDLDRAEQAYRQAGSYGWLAEPGLALLRLARGDTTAATAAIRRALAEATDRPLYRVPGRELTRSQVLPAYVEIMLAGGDLPAADRGAAELGVIAERYRTPALQARAAYALGSAKVQVATRIVVPAAVSGIVASFVLAISRAVGETMIVLVAMGQQPNLSFDPREAAEAMTAFIAATGAGDVPTGSIEYKTIFAVGATLFVMTLVMNIFAIRLVRKYREVYE